MLFSLFPQLLFLSYTSPTLLRVAAALCFAYMARDLWRRMGEITGVQLPLIGYPHAWMIQLSATVVGAISALLFLGAWTQGVALLAALVILKHLVFFRTYKNLLPFSKATYLLLLCICLSLVATGAGAFAFDLPL